MEKRIDPQVLAKVQELDEQLGIISKQIRRNGIYGILFLLAAFTVGFIAGALIF